MLTVNWDKFNYYVDVQVKDDLSEETITYKKLVWTKTKAEIDRWLIFANNALSNENNKHTQQLDDINNNINLWQWLVDEANNLIE